MALPKTHLLVAPSEVDNPFGRPISFAELYKGLKKANPSICIPLPEHYLTMGWDYPNAKGEHPSTCIWLGQPPSKNQPQPNSVKITAFNLSACIPEFTQLAPGGEIVQKGWRAIFSKIVRSGAASKEALEQIFKVELEYEGTADLCSACLAGGIRRKGQGAYNRCADHDSIEADVQKFKSAREESEWLLSRFRGTLHEEVSLAVRKFGSKLFPRGGSFGLERLRNLYHLISTRGSTSSLSTTPRITGSER